MDNKIALIGLTSFLAFLTYLSVINGHIVMGTFFGFPMAIGFLSSIK